MATENGLHLPGLAELRQAVAWAGRALPSRASLRRDSLAGLTVTVANVPDGLAGGVLAGVNPVYGLYANIVGPIAGGILSGSVLMVINNTSAVSLVAGQSIGGFPQEARDGALFLMVILSGVFQLIFGLLKLGRLTRFVSYSVMTGFLAGIAVLLILSQLPVVTGITVGQGNKITQTLTLMKNAGAVNLRALVLAVVAFGAAVLLRRTPLKKLASLLAIALPTLLLAALAWEGVQIVGDVGEMPKGVPLPTVPTLRPFFDVLTGALSLAVVVLIQGAGVSQSVPNPDGSRAGASRDFIAQGAANIASGLFRGLPVGGSLSATALNVVSGARRRWAAISAGMFTAVIVIGFPSLLSRVAMPGLGALLILAGITSIKPADVAAVWRVGWSARLIAMTTFVATLAMPIQAAVALGVTLSAIVYVFRASSEVTLIEIVMRSDGRIEERAPAEKLASNRVVVLGVYGRLFFAGARTLERQLPQPDNAENPVVVLRLRGQPTLGATVIDVLSKYADSLRAVNGRLYVAGLSRDADEHLLETGRFRRSGPLRSYEANSIVGESTRAARADAEDWLESITPVGEPEEPKPQLP